MHTYRTFRDEQPGQIRWTSRYGRILCDGRIQSEWLTERSRGGGSRSLQGRMLPFLYPYSSYRTLYKGELIRPTYNTVFFTK